MQIESNFVDGRSDQSELLERVLEQRAIIGFEMQFAVRLQNSPILVEKIDVRQTAFRMFVSRPRITEIDVNAIDFMFGKNLVDVCDIKDGKSDIAERFVSHLPRGGVENRGFGFQTDEVDIGSLLGDCGNEIALADSEFQIQFCIGILRKQKTPMPRPFRVQFMQNELKTEQFFIDALFLT